MDLLQNTCPSLKALDDFAFKCAVDLSARQPRCDKSIDQLTQLPLPSLSDSVAIWHQATGDTEQVTLATLAAIFTGSGGGPLAYNADLSALGIYNYGFFGGIAPGTAGTNSTAMTNMLAAMATLNGGLGGGTAYINVGSYQINAQNYYIPPQTSMVSPGTVVGQSSPGNVQSTFYVMNNGTLFTTTPGPIGFAGTYIHNIGFCFSLGASQSSANLVLSAANSSNVRFHQCTFTNCPQVLLTDNRCNSVGLTECTINYVSGPNNAPGGWNPQTTGTSGATGQGFCSLLFTSPNCYVMGPADIAQRPPPPFSTGPTGCIAIGITQSAEHSYISHLHLSDWDVPITYAISTGSGNGVNYSHFANLEVNCWTCAVFMVPYSNTSTIFGEKFINCNFFQAAGAATSGNSLVYLNPFLNGGGNHLIEDIEFTNCTIYGQGNGPTLYGLNIVGGLNIRMTGGCCSNMSATGGAGIAITGNCGYVQITGVNLQSGLNNAAHTQNQQYALLVTGSPVQPVLVSDCMMTNYSGNPVSVTGSPSELVIKNCIGYNDMNYIISGTAPTSGTAAQNAATLGGGAINYYGPSMVTGISNASNPTHLHISGTAYLVPVSSFFCFMLPNPSDQWFVDQTPTNFTWLGK